MNSSNTQSTPTNHASVTSQPPLTGPRPMQGYAPDPFEQPPAASPNKNLLIAGVAVGLGLSVVGAGLAFGGRSSASPTTPVLTGTPGTSIFDEQRQMMKEAVEMAKEAREAQREHINHMRAAMQEEYGDGTSGSGRDH